MISRCHSIDLLPKLWLIHFIIGTYLDADWMTCAAVDAAGSLHVEPATTRPGNCALLLSLSPCIQFVDEEFLDCNPNLSPRLISQLHLRNKIKLFD